MKTTQTTHSTYSNFSASATFLVDQEDGLWINANKRKYVSFSQPLSVLKSFLSNPIIHLTMKNFIMILLFVCSTLASQAQRPTPKDNFIVLLDLSDRLVAEDQGETDLALITALANRFIKTAKNKITFRSEDAFRIAIIPQAGSPLDARKYQSLLHLDLGQIPVALRAKKMKEWENQLGATLAQLYNEARYSINHADYQGVDIWQYFNEHLNDDLKNNANNHLLVITDGYFDFESYARQQQTGNRYTNTRFLRSLEGQTWHKTANENDFGLIPTTSLNAYDLQVIVGSIRPKKDDLTERAKLAYVWNKWLKEIGVKEYRLINHTYTEKMLGILGEAYK